MRNFLVQRHGGAASRPGTEFLGEVKDSSKTVRLIPFIFNADQTYVLEFGDQYMRVIRDGVYQTLTGQNITGITNANPCVVTYAGADTYANGDEVYVSGIIGAIGTYLNGRNFKVANVNAGANTFELKYMDGTAVNSTAFGAYASGGTVAEVYTVSTSYLEADLPEIQYVQSLDVITFTHPSYPLKTLSRSGHTSWTFADIIIGPSIDPPLSGLTINGVFGDYWYAVTSIKEGTLEESLKSTLTTNIAASAGTPVNISWDAVADASGHNIYKKAASGLFGFIGYSSASDNEFSDTGITPDTATRPPELNSPFTLSGNYPSCVSYAQQRQAYANTNNDPDRIWLSRTGQFTNFNISSPLQDDDAINFAIAGRQMSEVRHLVDIGALVVLTESGEWLIAGGSGEVITPTAINPKQQSYNGSSTLSPIVIDNTALYVQARGGQVRDIGFSYEADGYRGNDLTIFSSHLFDGYTIADWSYQKIPHSIVWAVRSDGTLLGLTYVREQQVLAWHKHDFDGTVENVCCVPEGNEDATYLVIARTIGGATKRYVERMTSRFVDTAAIEDFTAMDCHLSYDGRNTDLAHTMTLSGSGWTYEDTLTLTSSASYFESSDVGNEVHLTGADGTVIRFAITGYTSATVVTGKPNKTVPAAMQAVATATWSMAVDTVSGLWHIEGEAVSVFADGYVVGSPNNESYTAYTVASGSVTLDRCYGVIHVGLPYICDIETLDIDTVQGETLADKYTNINAVSLQLEKSRGGFFGARPPTDDATDPLEGLYELKGTSPEGLDAPIDLTTDKAEITIRSEWNSNGRVFVRQVDPVPMTVLSISPSGMIPLKG